MTNSNRSLLVVFTAAVDGREHEYNEWYDTVHLKDVGALPGVVAARRYELSDDQLPSAGSDPPSHHLATYDIEGDAGATLAEMVARMQDGRMTISPSLDRSRLQCWNYRLTTELTGTD